MLPDTILHIANDEEFQCLRQPELKAIKDGLIYVEDKDCNYYGWRGCYRGYLNAQGQRQGVGIVNLLRSKHIGEWHEDKLHGTAKIEKSEDGVSFWGQYEHGKKEGYLTIKYPNGRVSYAKFKNNLLDGYGIATYAYGEKVYRGEFKGGKYDGYGFIKYDNNDEYDGQWKNDS